MFNTKQLRAKPALGAFAALALFGLAGQAGAAVGIVAINPHDASVAPGGTALVSFDFNFGSTISAVGLDLYLTYNPDLLQLQLAQSSASYNGSIINPSDALNSAGWLAETNDPGNYTIVWVALDPNTLADLPPITLTGQGTVTYAFTLDPLVAAGSVVPVDLAFDYVINGTNPGDEPIPSPTYTATAHVNAVPLPASWVLALGAAAVLRGVSRKRPAGRRVSPIA